MSWNFGDLLEGIEAKLPGEAPALIHEERVLSWPEYARRSNNLASALVARGARPDDKLAFYMRNGTEYMETIGAAFKARLVHVNVNFRYRDEELLYIFDNSDARFVVFAPEFRDRVEAIRGRCKKVERWIELGGEARGFAESYEALSADGGGQPLALERSGQDLVFMYTGGTTGMPKAVMWRHEDLWGAIGGGTTIPANRGSAPKSPAEHIANVAAWGSGPRQLVACPLMHGTGLFSAIASFVGGGCIATLGGSHFDAAHLLDRVEQHRLNSVVIVGDAFARPILDALDANPDRWDLSSLKVMISSGVMWSREVKQGLLRHHPQMALADLFGSSEAIGFGSSITRAKGESKTARFEIGERCRVFSEDRDEIVPGSGEPGYIARSGFIPLGYYKDPEKTEKTFPTIGGTRWSIPGDWCRVEADGTITLLGRGSACINTGGEKVYPEEVEETLKLHPDVADALVFGTPHPRFGQAVTAVVQLQDGRAFAERDAEEEVLRAHVGERLASYKAPRRILAVPRMFRAPNGKADYAAARAFAEGKASSEG